MPASGYSSTLPDEVLIGTGVLYKGNTVFGVTRGGIRFDPGKTMRNVPYDGQRAPRQGLDRVESYAPRIFGTFIQFTAAKFADFEPGSTNASDVITPQTAGELLADADYFDEDTGTELRWLVELTDGTYWDVIFPVALIERYEVTGKNEEETEIACEFAARAKDDDTEGTPPYKTRFLATVS